MKSTLRSRSAMVAIGLLLGCLQAVPDARSQDWQAVEVKTVPVTDGIFMLQGRGGNIGVSVGADGVFLIDDQFAPLTEKIIAAVRALSDRPIRFLLNTHWHGDHTGGNENLGKAGVVIVAHHKVRDRLVKKIAQSGQSKVEENAGLPVLTFGRDVTFHLNGEAIRVTKMPPAHTDGDSIVHFPEANVIHMGDIYFNGLNTFFDASSGGRFSGMIAAIEQALDLSDERTKIIPGHGALSNRAELADHLERLKMVRERTLAAIAAGQGLADFVATRPTADLEAAFGGTYQVMDSEKFLGIVYTDLKKKK